ncbi:protein kinase domain-containing protein [Mesoterricola silvestris]|nr:protein kinase [Mesoterricola silvestris]
MERGLLTQEEIGLSTRDDAATLSEADLSERFNALHAAGRLKGVMDTALAWDQADTAVTSGTPDWIKAMGEVAAAMDPEDLAGFALPRDGRYLPLAFLGDGGMGCVYKAFDQQLKRVVALKFLKRLERAPMDRFIQEGRSQARIEHPNICNVYSVDEFEGQPYLSMRFIAGPTLRAALPRLSLEQKVGILMRVAQALQCCHREGIVHRDIKPTNIMLEAREDGSWWPFLMDFGLARDLGDQGLTVPGMIIGTPIYCSPEQVQGRMGDVDRRSDVYSLGATLYDCLVGEPPFPSGGALVDLIRRISEEDPVPPRQRVPGFPKDLQTIVMKALEKDPDRRYESARALAEDLQRYLDGDPIQAHHTTLTYRIARRVRKNRALALVTAFSLLAVLGFAAFGITMAVRARVQGQAIQRYGREAEYLEGILLKAYTLPLHDVRTERAHVEQHLERIRASMDTLGRWSRPAARLALGRGYLALDRLEEARRELEPAPGAIPQDPDHALALGLTLTRLYQAELEGLRGKALEERKRDTEQDLRRPALACLRRAQGAHQDGPAYVEGMLALVEERYADAIDKAKEYERTAPWAYEAWILEADAQRGLAALAYGRGDFDGTEQRLALAAEPLLQARNVARSAPLAYQGEVQRRMILFQLNLDRGRATEADRDWALEAADMCLTANPGDWKTLGYRAAIHRRWGVTLMNRNLDPTASLDAAVADAERGLAVRPTDNPLWNNLGTCLRNRADWELRRGLDPTRTLARAVEALGKGLDRPQYKDWLLDSIGNCHALLGHYQLEHGQDPTRAVLMAVDLLGQAAALKPWVGHNSSQGYALADLAAWLKLSGQDPMPRYEEARRAFEAGLGLNANSYLSHLGIANLLLDRAETELERGGAPGRDLTQAAEHLEAALKVNPRTGPEVYPARARCRALEALATRSTRTLAAARADLAKASRVSTGRPEAALAMAQAWLLVHRADPRSGAAAQGLAALRPALAGLPWFAQVKVTEGRLLAALGRPIEAEKAYARASALNPGLGKGPGSART